VEERATGGGSASDSRALVATTASSGSSTTTTSTASADTPVIDEDTLQRIYEVLETQRQAIGQLTNTLRKDLRDTSLIVQNLKPV